MFKTVLFPIDHSPESREAAETVANVVKTCASRLVILSVVELEAATTPSASEPDTTSPEGDRPTSLHRQNALRKLRH